jgi:signal transduction histidine kinase
MYAHLLLEHGETSAPVREDLAMIATQADRCRKIVSELLNFARQKQALYQTADLRDLVQRGLATVPPPDNVTMTIDHQVTDPVCEVDPDQSRRS